MLRALVVALSLVLCLGYVQAQEKAKVPVLHAGEGFAYIPLFLANIMGYFNDVGLDVEVIRGGSGSQPAAAILNGDAQINVGSTVTLVNAVANGADMKAFASLVSQYTSTPVISAEWAKKHGITGESTKEQQLAALKCARLDVTGPGSGADPLIRYLVREGGMDPDSDVEMVNALNGFFYSAATAQDKWLKENSETATKFATAMQMALDTFRNPEKSHKARGLVHQKYHDNTSADIYAALWDSQDKTASISVEITPKMISQLLEFNNRFVEKKLDSDSFGQVCT